MHGDDVLDRDFTRVHVDFDFGEVGAKRALRKVGVVRVAGAPADDGVVLHLAQNLAERRARSLAHDRAAFQTKLGLRRFEHTRRGTEQLLFRVTGSDANSRPH